MCTRRGRRRFGAEQPSEIYWASGGSPQGTSRQHSDGAGRGRAGPRDPGPQGLSADVAEEAAPLGRAL